MYKLRDFIDIRDDNVKEKIKYHQDTGQCVYIIGVQEIIFLCHYTQLDKYMELFEYVYHKGYMHMFRIITCCPRKAQKEYPHLQFKFIGYWDTKTTIEYNDLYNEIFVFEVIE